MELNHGQEMARLQLRTQQLETVSAGLRCCQCASLDGGARVLSNKSCHSPHVPMPQELSVSQQKVLELQQQVTLLHVAAAAKGLELTSVLTTAAETQRALASAAQQSLLAAAAATASKGTQLITILEAAESELKLSAATAQQQLFQAAAAAAAAGMPLPPAPSVQGEPQVHQHEHHGSGTVEGVQGASL